MQHPQRRSPRAPADELEPAFASPAGRCSTSSTTCFGPYPVRRLRRRGRRRGPRASPWRRRRCRSSAAGARRATSDRRPRARPPVVRRRRVSPGRLVGGVAERGFATYAPAGCGTSTRRATGRSTSMAAGHPRRAASVGRRRHPARRPRRRRPVRADGVLAGAGAARPRGGPSATTPSSPSCGGGWPTSAAGRRRPRTSWRLASAVSRRPTWRRSSPSGSTAPPCPTCRGHRRSDMVSGCVPPTSSLAVRRRQGSAQAELARRAGTSQPVISAYEHGRRDPTVGTPAPPGRRRRASACGSSAERRARRRPAAAHRRARARPPAARRAVAGRRHPGPAPAPHPRGRRAPARLGLMPTLAERVLAIEGRSPAPRCPTPSAGRWPWLTTPSPGRPIDIDLNVVRARRPGRRGHLRPLRALGVAVSDDDEALARDGQARVWWDATPIDLFFAYDRFPRAPRQAAGAVPVRRRDRSRSSPPCTSSCARPSSTGPRTGSTSTPCWPTTPPSTSPRPCAWVGRIAGDDDQRYDRLAAVLSR